MKKIILIVFVFSTYTMQSQDTHYQGVRVKNMSSSQPLDNIITTDVNGLYHKSVAVFGDVAFLINNQTFTGNNTFTGQNVFNGNNVTIINESGANLLLNSNTGATNSGVYMSESGTINEIGAYVYYSGSANEFRISTGTTSLTDRYSIARDTGNHDFKNGTATFGNDIYSHGLVVDPLGTTTNIASSVLTVKNQSTSTSTNVTQFIDVDRNNTTDSPTGETSGLVSRVINSSANSNDGIYGSQLIGRNTASGNTGFVYGSFSTADHSGSGNVDFLTSSVLRTNITGTNTSTVDFNRGFGIDLTIDNPNITVNNAQSMHTSIQMNAGTIGTATGLFLDMDYDGDGVTVTGDINYVLINNDVLPTPTGNTYAIKSNTTAPSDFAGSITATSFIGDGSQLTGINAGALTKSVNYTASQILAGTEVEVIAAPGSGMFIDIISVNIDYIHNTTSFNQGEIVIRQNGANMFNTPQLSVFSSNALYKMDLSNPFFAKNNNVSVDVAGALPTTGDGQFTVYVTYKIINTN